MALKIAVFGSGAVLMALEILAFRIIGKTFGSALRETTAVIAVFLISMSLGYLLGGKAGDRWPGRRTLVLPMVGAGLYILLIPMLDDAISERIFDSALPLGLHAIAACTIFFVVPSLLMATASPIAIRLLSLAVEQTGKTAGSVAALSTMGSIIGTVLTGFYLIDVFGSVKLLTYALGGTMLVLSAIAALGVRAKAAAAGLMLVLFAAGGASANVIYERDSSFHHIVVREEDGMRVLYFDNAPQSQMKVADPVSGSFEYCDYFSAAFLFKPDIKDALMLGLGGGSIPKRFLQDYPDVRMDVVDVDAQVVDVAKRFFAVKPGPRLNLVVADGRAYIKRSKKQYDYILIDAYSRNRYGSTIPSHLTTREFFEQVSARLRPGGILAYNVIAQVGHHNGGIVTALVKTMGTQFTTPYLFQAESSWNTVIVAFKGTPRKLTADDLTRRAKEMAAKGQIKIPGFEARAGNLAAVPDLKKAVLMTDDYAPVDRLLRGN